VTKFAACVALILLCESCKFGEKTYYSNCDNEFLRDCFFYWRTLYMQGDEDTNTVSPHLL